MQKVEAIEKPIRFSENQKFRQVWVWLFIVISVIAVFYALIDQTLRGNHLGNPPIPDGLVLFLFALFGIALPVSLFAAELRVRVTDEGLYVKFFPIHRRWLFFSPDEMERFEKVHYRPIVEYGGWGIRVGIHGKAYSVSGKNGVRIEFKNGKKLLIGTQKADEFERSIGRIMKR